MRYRAIAKIVIFDGIAYQTDQFSRSIYLGDPINICNVLSDQGCQEINLLFVGTAPSLNFVSSILSVCRSPVSVGGVGVNMEEYAKIVASGAEKIIISDSLWNGSDKAQLLSDRFGRQAVAASIDYIEKDEQRIVVTGRDRKQIVGPLEQVIKGLPKDSFGEVILTNVSRDGQAVGLDYEVLGKSLSNLGGFPLLLCGGYNGELNNAISRFDGFISCSYFSLFGKHRAALINYPNEFSVIKN
jgi:imidazole glycerol-phosphate synthase subunit HisF